MFTREPAPRRLLERCPERFLIPGRAFLLDSSGERGWLRCALRPALGLMVQGVEGGIGSRVRHLLVVHPLIQGRNAIHHASAHAEARWSLAAVASCVQGVRGQTQVFGCLGEVQEGGVVLRRGTGHCWTPAVEMLGDSSRVRRKNSSAGPGIRDIGGRSGEPSGPTSGAAA